MYKVRMADVEQRFHQHDANFDGRLDRQEQYNLVTGLFEKKNWKDQQVARLFTAFQAGGREGTRIDGINQSMFSGKPDGAIDLKELKTFAARGGD